MTKEMTKSLDDNAFLDKAVDMKYKLVHIISLLEKYYEDIPKSSGSTKLAVDQLNESIHLIEDECDALVEKLISKIRLISHELNMKTILLEYCFKNNLNDYGEINLLNINLSEKQNKLKSAETNNKNKYEKFKEYKVIIDEFISRAKVLDESSDKKEIIQDIRMLVSNEIMNLVTDLNFNSYKIIKSIKELTSNFSTYQEMFDSEKLFSNLDYYIPRPAKENSEQKYIVNESLRPIDFSSLPLSIEQPVNGFNRNILCINLPLITNNKPDYKAQLSPKAKCTKCQAYINCYTPLENSDKNGNVYFVVNGIVAHDLFFQSHFQDVEFISPFAILKPFPTNLEQLPDKLLVFCIDVSGSMSGRRIESIKKTCVESLRAISKSTPNYKVALITFSEVTNYYGSGNLIVPEFNRLGAYDFIEKDSYKSDLIKKSIRDIEPISSSVNQLVKSIRKLATMGESYINSALAESVVLASAIPDSEVFLCTDGVVYDQEEDFYNSIIDYCNNNGNVKLNVVTFDEYDCDLKSLNILSDRTGGTLYTTNSDIKLFENNFHLEHEGKYFKNEDSMKIMVNCSSRNIKIDNSHGNIKKDDEILLEIFILNKEELEKEDEIIIQVVIENINSRTRVITEKIDKSKSKINNSMIHAYTLRKISRFIIEANDLNGAYQMSQAFSDFLNGSYYDVIGIVEKLFEKKKPDAPDYSKKKRLLAESKYNIVINEKAREVFEKNLNISSESVQKFITKSKNNSDIVQSYLEHKLQRSLQYYENNNWLNEIKDDDMRNFWNGIEKNMNESSLGNCVQNLISGQDNIQNYLLFELVNMCISINRRAEFLNTSLLDINNYETTAALTAGVSNRLENEKFISEIENLYSDIDLNGSCCFKSVEKLDLLVSNDLNGLIACASKNMYNETPILISKYLNFIDKNNEFIIDFRRNNAKIGLGAEPSDRFFIKHS